MNYVLYGEEQYLLEQSLDRIVKTHLKDKNDLNCIVYDANTTALEVILEDAMTIPFFTDCKVIKVYHADFLSSSNDKTVDTSALEHYLDHPMETTVLILIGDFEKLDARKKIVKKVQKTCKVLQYRKLDEQGKVQYVNDQIKKRGLRIDQNAIALLLKRLPLDINIIQKEFDKLELFGDDISSDLVSKLISRPLEEDVFQLVDAVVKKNIGKAFYIWRDLCVLNKDAIYLIALLASQFRFLFEVKVLSQKGMLKNEIADRLKAHPYRVQLALSSIQFLSVQYLIHILEKLASLDQNLKAGRIDKKLGFEIFLLELQGELK